MDLLYASIWIQQQRAEGTGGGGGGVTRGSALARIILAPK